MEINWSMVIGLSVVFSWFGAVSWIIMKLRKMGRDARRREEEASLRNITANPRKSPPGPKGSSFGLARDIERNKSKVFFS
jgi:hypothetical protein